eukprot:COSAG01_NODE_920_length_12728_cov_38.396864_3_plen_90_part_00
MHNHRCDPDNYGAIEPAPTTKRRRKRPRKKCRTAMKLSQNSYVNALLHDDKVRSRRKWYVLANLFSMCVYGTRTLVMTTMTLPKISRIG